MTRDSPNSFSPWVTFFPPRQFSFSFLYNEMYGTITVSPSPAQQGQAGPQRPDGRQGPVGIQGPQSPVGQLECEEVMDLRQISEEANTHKKVEREMNDNNSRQTELQQILKAIANIQSAGTVGAKAEQHQDGGRKIRFAERSRSFSPGNIEPQVQNTDNTNVRSRSYSPGHRQHSDKTCDKQHSDKTESPTTNSTRALRHSHHTHKTRIQTIGKQLGNRISILKGKIEYATFVKTKNTSKEHVKSFKDGGQNE